MYLDSPLIYLLILQGELRKLLWELRQFASYFAIPVRESVAHIYLSALAFSPASSCFHEIYQRCQGMVTVKRGRPLDWPLLVHTFHHTDLVMCVAFSPDGTQIVSGSEGNTAGLSNVNPGSLFSKLCAPFLIVLQFMYSLQALMPVVCIPIHGGHHPNLDLIFLSNTLFICSHPQNHSESKKAGFSA